MKYVVFKFRSIYIPVIVPNHCTHSQVKIVGATAVSAGHFIFREGHSVAYGESESMQLQSVPDRDTALLRLLLSNAPTSSFLIDRI